LLPTGGDDDDDDIDDDGDGGGGDRLACHCMASSGFAATLEGTIKSGHS
jgi:hypothetical protein